MAQTVQQTFQGFYRGISQDDYSTQANQVLFSSGLDLNSDTYTVGLEADKTDLITTNGNAMLAGFYVEDSGGNRTAALAGENGEVYLSNGTNDIADFIFADGWDVVNTSNMGGNVYFIRRDGTSQVKIGKMDENNTSISGVTETITTSGDTIPNATVKSTYPVYVFGNETILIGIGGTLVRLDKTDVVTNYELFADAIVDITKIGSTFRIRSSTGETYFWTFNATGISESYNVGDYIRGGINLGTSDIVISGFNSDETNILNTSGYSAPILASRYKSDRLTEEKFKIRMERQTHMTKIGDTVYMVNQTGSTYDALWSYGSKLKSLGNAFQEILPINPSGLSKIDCLYGLQSGQGDEVYMGVTIDGVEQIVKYTIGGTKQASGYMILPIIDGNSRTNRKKMKALYNLVSGCSADNTIKNSVSYDQAADVELRTITDTGNSVRVPIKADVNKQWNDYVLRVDFTDGGSGTPKLHGIRVVYEIIED